MNAVTGAFGFIGRHIASRLLKADGRVRTITSHPDKPNPFGEAVTAHPFSFDQPDQLVAALDGCDVLYNTYWIRFDRGDRTFSRTVENTKILFDSALAAGVKRVVHISVTGIRQDDHLPYFEGKRRQEHLLRESGIKYSIVRPTLVYGPEDILVNNIAWTLRRFPVVPVFGDGKYLVQPIFVDDLADIAVSTATLTDSVEIDAIGPETFTYEEFVGLIKKSIGSRSLVLRLHPKLGISLGKAVGLLKRDVLLTSDELTGLMESRLRSEQEPNGTTRFSDWVVENRDSIGTSYTSELDRHFRWKTRN